MYFAYTKFKRKAIMSREYPDKGRSSVSLYLRQAAGTDLLTLEEEREVSAKSFAGCPRSVETMILSNLFLVVEIAGNYTGSGVPLGDLINEGNIGLMKAVTRYDPSHKNSAKFSTYAGWWIRHYIIRACRSQARVVRVPINQIEKLSKINKAISAFYSEFGRNPTVDEISEETGFTPRTIRISIRTSSKIVSIDDNLFPGSDLTLADTLSADNERVDATLVKKEYLDLLSDSLSVLTEKEKKIIQRRFGLDGFKEETLENIGLSFGLTRERIRQIEAKALTKIRERIEELQDL
jgi:RNA polymerase primary sigma factor